ncbi:TadE family type IV pilus minor pilin [Sphaerisporangium sp. NPDC049002]|uniref:TadE family type IV pilus minor pilin n=1 Tax=unclassified Sphaerisporangium TaxID=2630420 RepID=UPI0033E78494
MKPRPGSAERVEVAQRHSYGRATAERRGLVRADGGSVTAEMAVALPSLVLVLGAALWAIAAVTAQLECVDAARAGARAAARGESLEAVRQAAARAAPEGAIVSVTRDSALSRVTISTSVRPSWVIAVPAVPVGASASSATELGADAPPSGDLPASSPLGGPMDGS